MKICVICPVDDLEKFATKGDMHLLLTHLVEPDNAYTKFYAARKELKILDNGLFEHHVASPTSEILAKAKLVGADVVIAPDVLYDPVGTVKNAEIFAKEVHMENGRRRGRGLRPLQMMAVPQAGNRKDYLWCYDRLVRQLNFQWIGLSILACPNAFSGSSDPNKIKQSRIATYRALKETGLWSSQTNHHLLGLGSHIDEVEFFAPIAEIKSNDSSSAVLHGQMGITYENGAVPGGKKSHKLDFEAPTDPKFEEAVLKNIIEWKMRASFDPA